MEKLTILTTGAGAPGAAGIFKGFRMGAEQDGKQLRIITSDMDRYAYGFHLADKGYVIPEASSPRFIQRLMEICRKERPDLLFSWVTPELLKISRFSENFKNIDVIPVVSGMEAIEISQNKPKCFELFSRISPKFRVVETLEDFEKTVKEFGYPEKNVCFKPVSGYGMRGFRILSGKANLLEEKPEKATTDMASALNMLASYDEFPEIVVMEYLSGKEYTVDMLLDNGNPVLTVPRERFRIKSGISNIAVIKENQEIAGTAEKIAKKLDLSYNANIQFKLDENKKPKLIEVQPRLSGTVIACIGAGVNFPYMAAKLALGESFEKPEIKWETTMKRFWNEVFIRNGEKWFL